MSEVPAKGAGWRAWLSWIASLLLRLAERALNPWPCVLWIVLVLPRDLEAAWLKWITSIEPIQFLNLLLSWPAVAFLLLATIGPQYIRDFLSSIESLGELRRVGARRHPGPTNNSDPEAEGDR